MKKLDMEGYVPTEVDVPDLSGVDLSHNYAKIKLVCKCGAEGFNMCPPCLETELKNHGIDIKEF